MFLIIYNYTYTAQFSFETRVQTNTEIKVNFCNSPGLI